MAKKKSKVPTPPRTVQAPKRRDEPRAPRGPRGPRDPRQTKLLLAGLGGGVIVAVIVVVGVLVAGGGGDGGKISSAEAAAAGCVAQDFPSMGRNHVLGVKPDFKYNSFPPTSGPHYPQTAIYNAYSDPVDPLRLIHNLEHGGVIVQHGDKVAQPDIDGILAWYRDDPNGMIVAPLPELGDKIALRAWTHLLTCSKGFNEKVFSDFRDAYRFNGPEAVPSDAMAPGSQ